MAKSQCFKIVGNFQQCNVWSQPDPGFVGHILVNTGDGSFKGYMEEQYPSDYDITRLVSGVFNEKMGRLIYYKLAKDPDVAPILYMFWDISSLGDWFAITRIGNLIHSGVARVKLEPVSLTDEILGKIEAAKESVLAVSDPNRRLFSKGSSLLNAFG